LGKNLSGICIIIIGIILLAGVPITGIAAAIYCGVLLASLIGSGLIASIIFFPIVFLILLFLSGYVWTPYLWPALKGATDALTDANLDRDKLKTRGGNDARAGQRRSPITPKEASQNTPPEQEPLILSREQKLRQAQADHQHWSEVAARPGLRPAVAHWARQAAASAEAEVQLRQKALQHAQTLLRQGQPISSEKENPHSSTKPGTSGSTT
jgi:hypothetical protein